MKIHKIKIGIPEMGTFSAINCPKYSEFDAQIFGVMMRKIYTFIWHQKKDYILYNQHILL